MKFKLLVALFAASALITGCDEKKESGDDDKKEDGDKKDKKDKKDKDEKKGGVEIPKECKEYMTALDNCVKDLPAEAKPGLEAGKKAIEDSFAALKDLDAAAAKPGLDALVQSCQQAAKAMEATCKK